MESIHRNEEKLTEENSTAVETLEDFLNLTIAQVGNFQPFQDENQEHIAFVARKIISRQKDEISLLDARVKFADTKRSELASDISQAKDLVVESLDNDSISTELAESLAEIFGWELTKEVDVEITAVVRATVTVPMGCELSEVTEKLSVDVMLNRWGADGFELSVDYTDSVEVAEI